MTREPNNMGSVVNLPGTERQALQTAYASQQQTVDNSAKLRASLDTLAADTQRLADAGNPNARALVDELKKTWGNDPPCQHVGGSVHIVDPWSRWGTCGGLSVNIVDKFYSSTYSLLTRLQKHK